MPAPRHAPEPVDGDEATASASPAEPDHTGDGQSDVSDATTSDGYEPL
jgi:hypothetical protein